MLLACKKGQIWGMLIGFGNLHLLIFWSSLSNKVHISKHGVTMKFRAVDPHISNSSEVDSVSWELNSKLTGELWKENCKSLFFSINCYHWHFSLSVSSHKTIQSHPVLSLPFDQVRPVPKSKSCELVLCCNLSFSIFCFLLCSKVLSPECTQFA